MSSLSIGAGVARQADYWWTVYRRTWRGSIVSSFLSPVFYVLAMGVMLGGFIEGDPARLEGATTYLAFVVPGLVASQAMQTAVGEVTYPVMGSIKWHKTYYAQLATPLAAPHLVAGQLAFVLFRLVTTCGVFMVVLVPFGVFATWWGWLLALASEVLVGLAFATVIYGITARMHSEEGFGVIFRFVVIPMVLFSGAFFPVSNLGGWAWLAKLTPLWHGVDLTRMLCLDTVDWSLAGRHVLVLLAMAGWGWWWTVRGLTRRLEQ